MTPSPLTRIGPYQVVERIGAGGMGEVFRGRDTRLERDVALKLLPPEFARDADRLARFRREALTLASLQHPNIATLFGIESLPEGGLMLVLEFVEGGTLTRRLEAGALSVPEALAICAQVAEALEVAHERGVIHRDLKPLNVMFGARGLVKVLDFGLAQRAGDALGEDDASSGSPGYLSPEQALGLEQDARTDIFAFGCVLYECLSGTRAFAGTTSFEAIAATLHGAVDMARLPAATPARVRALIERCLDKDPATRLAEMREARLELEEALGTRRASALRAGEATAAPLAALPRPGTRFIGRERDLGILRTRLAQTRLLTLTGIGGCGKTRLALQLAEDAVALHPDGTWFVDLSALAEAERVPETLATALGVRAEPGRELLESVFDWLASRRALLVLDNCEHLLGACAELLERLFARCPEVRVLATSREGLALPEESLYAVPALELPPRDALVNAEAAGAFDAVRLFIERAEAALPGFALTDAQAPVVVELCRRLDGIPLAIELAAARVRVISPEQIRDRLDDRFRLLTGGQRKALPRHQTLRATLQWSYDLLSPAEQGLLRPLGVFAGGWTLERATDVCEGDEFEILDLLTHLADKSLVVVERGPAGHARYRFLESVRQFALEQLNAAGEGPLRRERHLAVFLSLAESAERGLLGPAEATWRRELEDELENLLAALAFCAEVPAGGAPAVRLAVAIWRFWSSAAHFELGRRALESALALPGAEGDGAARAHAQVRAGGLALYLGDLAGARPHIEAGLAAYRALGDDKGVARALSGLATVATLQSDYATARTSYEESFALYAALGEARGAAVTLHNLGYVALCEGRTADARTAFADADARLLAVGDRKYLALCRLGAAEAALHAGDPAAAQPLFAAGLKLARELEAPLETAYGLEGVAQYAIGQGAPAAAARLLGAAQAVRERIGSPPPQNEAELREETTARLRDALGPEILVAHLATGAALALPAAYELADSVLAEAVEPA